MLGALRLPGEMSFRGPPCPKLDERLTGQRTIPKFDERGVGGTTHGTAVPDNVMQFHM